MEQSIPGKPSWLESTKTEVQKLLTEDFNKLIKQVSEEEKHRYEALKIEAEEKLRLLEEETKTKLQKAEQKSEIIREELIESIKEDYILMKNRYLAWLK